MNEQEIVIHDSEAIADEPKRMWWPRWLCRPKATNERTSPKVAAIAAKVLSGEITTRNIKVAELKALAGSALTQTRNKK